MSRGVRRGSSEGWGESRTLGRWRGGGSEYAGAETRQIHQERAHPLPQARAKLDRRALPYGWLCACSVRWSSPPETAVLFLTAFLGGGSIENSPAALPVARFGSSGSEATAELAPESKKSAGSCKQGGCRWMGAQAAVRSRGEQRTRCSRDTCGRTRDRGWVGRRECCLA